MQVSFNFLQPQQNRTYSVAGLNARFAQQQGQPVDKKTGLPRTDRVTISPQGKMMSTLQNLQQQKKELFEQRRDLVSRNKEKGGTIKDIEEQLKLFQEQAEGIDKQIAQLQADMAKAAVEKETEKKAKKSADQDETAEEAETAKLTALAGVSDSLRQTQTVTEVKERKEGEVRVKEGEIKLGALRIDDLKSRAKTDGANVTRMVKNAQKLLDKEQDSVDTLEEKVQQLTESAGKKLAETKGELEEEQGQE